MARSTRLGPDDWARLRDVRLRALDDEPDAFGSTFAREREFDEAEWRRLLGLGPWWVWAHDGEDVGLVAGGHHGDPAVRWVYSMWVADALRGTGIAAALLDDVVSWAASEGVDTLGLDVADRVPRARRFYERRGFVAGAVLPMPRDPSIELTEMSLDLSTLTGVRRPT